MPPVALLSESILVVVAKIHTFLEKPVAGTAVGRLLADYRRVSMVVRYLLLIFALQ